MVYPYFLDRVGRNKPFKRNWPCPVIISLILVALISIAEANIPLDEARLKRLMKGDVLVNVIKAEGPSKGMVAATVLIDAPVEHVWQVMTDCGEIPTFVPGVESCQIMSSGPNWEIIKHEVKWIWLFPKLAYVFRATYQKNEQIDFVRIDGDLKAMKGVWQLSPWQANSKTIVHYRVYLDPGFFVPQWLVRRALKKDLPAVLTALRSKVLKSGSEPKP